MRRLARRAFTLTELLVVIAISTILLGLLLYPIFYAQQITNRMQSQATAQDAARNGVERISRELAQATFIFDNTTTPIIIPLGTRTINFDNAVTSTPRILFGRLDYILPESRSGNTGDPVDPTTGKPMSGTNVTFPLAPGTRVVRQFLGLADNTKPYANRYEFRGEDNDFNPVVLWRAEFDPSDPNLINQSAANPFAAGGFNDPNFFYNTNVAPNGRTFAENWRRKASATIQGPRLDMLAWRRDGSRELVLDLPIQTLAHFSPAAVVGDTANAGSLTAGNAEVPGAPPTLYSAQHGQWALPFSVSFFRSATTTANQGTIKFTVNLDTSVTPGRIRVVLDSSSGTLATAPGEVFTSLSATTGKIFVKTPRLTFAIDALRGRIETGFPPLAGTSAGIPMFVNTAGTVAAMAASPYPDANYGELVPTALSVSTLDPRAGGAGVRPDQGLWGIDAFEATTTRYLSGAATYNSPLRIFGNTDAAGIVQNAGGIMIAPGTEQVLGPEIPLSTSPQLLPYSRVNTIGGEGLLTKGSSQSGPTNLPYAPVTGQRNYILSQFLRPNYALFQFDSGNGVDIGGASIGLLGATDAQTPGLPAGAPRELRISYLWQNNYARDADGAALGADDLQILATDPNASGKPEGDVVKVDYSSRALLNIQIGARVHDSNAPVPQTILYSDKVRVGNAVR